MHLLDEEVLEAAVTVQKLQRRRANLKALHHKLQVRHRFAPCLRLVSFVNLALVCVYIHHADQACLLVNSGKARFSSALCLIQIHTDTAVQDSRPCHDRHNLADCLQVVDHVTQSQYALELLLPQGDYAGALDIMSDIQACTTPFLTTCSCT